MPRQADFAGNDRRVWLRRRVFGTFAAWIVGLVNAAGPAMLTYLAIGAGIGGIRGYHRGDRDRYRRASRSRRA